MCSMLYSPAVDSEFCRQVYFEEPGDIAEEISRFNLVTLPESMPFGVFFWTSCIAAPVPFHVRPFKDYRITINLGPSFAMDTRLPGEKRTTVSEPGSMFIAPVDCAMRLAYRGLEEFRSLTFSCSRNHLEQVAINAGLPFAADGLPPARDAAGDSQALHLSRAIIEELRSEHGVPLLLESLTIALSAHIVRRAAGSAIEARRSRSGLAPYVLRRVTDYVKEHLQRPISLSDLATVAGLSTYHFCRMFKHSTGMPPYQYLAQARLGRAKQLLLQTTLPIADVGFDAGFGSSSQFSHFFKKWTRCTPQEYRRQGRNMKRH